MCAFATYALLNTIPRKRSPLSTNDLKSEKIVEISIEQEKEGTSTTIDGVAYGTSWVI